MCVICVKPKNAKFPSIDLLWQMWERNPHGAGFMFVRDNQVQIRKGYMDFNDYINAIDHEGLSTNQVVIFHFRISTQAGVNPYMTHPFPITSNMELMKKLSFSCNSAICHNGIIRMTSNGSSEYSDTALFVGNYLTHLTRNYKDIRNNQIQEMIYELIQSKMVILDKFEYYTLIGNFSKDKETGLLFSNEYFRLNYKSLCKNQAMWHNLQKEV